MATAVVVAVTSVPVVAAGPAVAVPGGVSGAVAMGGGASGEIDLKTGALRAVLPLVSLPGRGGAGVDLVLGYDQAAAGAGADRHGLGAGIGLGKAFVDPADGGTLHTPGGSFEISAGDRTGTGLKRYLLKDLALREDAGTLPAGGGAGAVEYRWVLSYDDGRKNFFSAEGDLVAEQDVFGHRAVYGWERAGEQRRLVKAVDGWGQAVTFDYGTQDRVTVALPERSDGQRPEVVLGLSEGRLVSVMYPEGQEMKLAWDYAPQGMPGRLLTRAEAPSGAVTQAGYAQPHGFPVASSLKVTDPAGRNLAAERTFTLGGSGEQEGHDFTGRGQYASADELFDSADPDYRYTTELSDGRSTVRSVFNSLHLLKERTASLAVNGELRPVRTQELEYGGEREEGRVPPPASGLPADYGKPVKASVTVHDPATGASRTTTETARFDDHGRPVEHTDATGAVTVTAYDLTALDQQDSGAPAGYGLPLKTVTTGTDGAQTVSENTLSEDRRSITAVRQSVKNKGDAGPSARTVATFTLNGEGETTGKTVTWAEGARPEGAEGPDSVTETYTSSTDTARHERTDTAAGPGGVTSQVTDLVTGLVTRATDTAGRTTERTYDGAGRVLTEKSPGGEGGTGLTTTVSYTPLSTTVSAPGQGGRAHVTVEERDLLGRVVKTTDNISGGELTGDPAARTLQSTVYENEGRTVKVTDGAGRTSVTEYDDLGRPVRAVAPNGMTQLAVYADAATAGTSQQTVFLLPAGESDPARAVRSSTTTFDQAGRTTATAPAFADGTQLSGTSQSYDSLGRPGRSLSQDIATDRTYGRGGTAGTTTLTPQSEDFPGARITASTRADLTGASSSKTLTSGEGQSAESRTGTSVVRDAAGRTVQQVRPDGGKSLLTYTPAGQADTAVSPAGTRTSYTWDKDSGRLAASTRTSADGTQTEMTGYTYDPYTGAVTEVFDPRRKDETKITYTYDADGNTTRVAYPDGKTVRQAFDSHGQRTSVTDTAGLTTFYTYNSDGTLAAAVQRQDDGEDSPAVSEVSYTYDGLGRITTVDRGNGVTTRITYTSAGQTSTEKTVSGADTLAEASYIYDRHGSLTQRTDERPAAGADGSAGQKTKTTTRYTYDAYSRLTGSEILAQDGTPLTTTRYKINVSGDVTAAETTSHTGGQAGQTTLTEHLIDTAGRLTTVKTGGTGHAQTFDDEGNLITDRHGTTYTYNLDSQPVSRTTADGKKTTYTYWADGSRAASTEHTEDSPGTAAAVTRFYYAPGQTLINDTHTPASDPSAETTASYLLAGTRESRTLTGPGAAQAASTGAGYLIHDRHGSTTALTGPGGTATAAWNYTDYGQHASPAGQPHTSPAQPAGAARNPFTHAGEYTNPDGTQYLRTRTLDPATGRFTTPDPAPLHNRYQAMDANPVMKTDPSGTTAIWDYIGYGISAAVTIGAILLTFLAPPAGPAAVAAAAGLIADTAGLVLESIALAHDATSFLGSSPAVRDGLLYSGMALAITGGLTSIGTSLGSKAHKTYQAYKLRAGQAAAGQQQYERLRAQVDAQNRKYAREYARDQAAVEATRAELAKINAVPTDQWIPTVSQDIQKKYPAVTRPGLEGARIMATTDVINSKHSGIPAVKFADGDTPHVTVYDASLHGRLKDIIDEQTYMGAELYRLGMLEPHPLKQIGDVAAASKALTVEAAGILRNLNGNTRDVYHPTKYVTAENGPTLFTDASVYPRSTGEGVAQGWENVLQGMT
ncbi:RHS repeat-associated core domain-containing protein [Streptomyces sp. NPDC096030]|uniref:RHS repeat domain-containing protein n=1 Tax=Streptomyces sp. NPDC096030 TaxID=3155423 RepID=UPI0033271926